MKLANTRGQIAALALTAACALAAPQALALPDDRQQPVPHDLQLDLLER